MKNLQKEIPVVLIVFNRLETTQLVIDKIRQWSPEKMFIIADGPRDQDEKIKCDQLLQYVFDQIDWSCTVEKNISSSNMGCGKRISSGLKWVFEHTDMAIILEDDCLPAISFFEFCSELLLKYKDNNRIMHIAGNRINEEFCLNQDSYFFSRNTPIWGWATWARAWNKFDYQIKSWKDFIQGNYHKYIFSESEQKYWSDIFDSVSADLDGANTWDYQWQYCVFINDGLSVLPEKNLISNIGDIDATHGIGDNFHYARNIVEDFKITNHPKFIIRNIAFDEYHFKKYNYKPTLKKFKEKVQRKLKTNRK